MTNQKTSSNSAPNASPQTIGWREWVALPELGIPAIKAKIDTGAKTSALHAFSLECYTSDLGVEMVRFQLHPLRRRKNIVINCDTPIVDRRQVKDSGGHLEERIVIETIVEIGELRIVTPVTLTSREDMLFRMLVGRRFIAAAEAVVDVSSSYCCGKEKSKAYGSSRRQKGDSS